MATRERGIGPVPEGIPEELATFLGQLRRIAAGSQQAPAGRRAAAGLAGGGTGPGGGGSPGGGTSDEPDLTPPPTPSGVVVLAGLDFVGITTDPPTFTMGHGYGRTLVYGAKYVGDGTTPPLPTFTDAVLVHEFVGQVGAFPTEPATQWHIWVKWRTRDGVESVSPAGGANGYEATTGQDVSRLLEALTGQITESQLYATLGTRLAGIESNALALAQEVIDRTNAVSSEASARQTLAAQLRGSYTGADLNALTSGLLYQERATRVTQVDALATSISLISAGVASGFDPAHIWYFDSTDEGWSGANATVSASDGFLHVVGTGANPQLQSPVLDVLGSRYASIKARIKRTAGSGWVGRVYYETSGHGRSASHYADLPDPGIAVDDTAGVEWDMTTLAAGGADWTSSTITRIWLDLGAGAADSFDVDWIGVGRNSPGASQAALADVVTAMAAADSAQVSRLESLEATVDDPDTGVSATAAALNTVEALVTSGTNGNVALASSLSALSATVGGHTTAIAQEASVRADETGHLGAQWTVRMTVGNVAGGFGLAGTSSEDEGATIDFGIRANKFFIAAPEGVSGVPSLVPFSVVTVPTTTAAGEVLPAGVYIDALYVKGLEAVLGRFNTALITNAMIVSLSASKITAGSIAVGEYVQSSGYVPGLSGFRINGGGTAEFNDVVVRGTVYATDGEFDGQVTIRDPGGAIIFQSGGNLDINRLSGSVVFSPSITWDFNGSANGWAVLNNATLTTTATYLRVTSTGSDPIIASPAFSIAGATYDKVRARVRRVAGAGWDGSLFYANGVHSFDGAFYKTITDPGLEVGGDWKVLEWDMAALSGGGTDWLSGTTTQIRPDLGATAADVFDIDWISIGRSGPVQVADLDNTIVRASNPITAANASTYIADAWIGQAIVDGALKSSGYSPGVSGWQITKAGGAEFDAASIRGRLTAGQIEVLTGTARSGASYSGTNVSPDGAGTVSASVTAFGGTKTIAGSLLDVAIKGVILIYLKSSFGGPPKGGYTMDVTVNAYALENGGAYSAHLGTFRSLYRPWIDANDILGIPFALAHSTPATSNTGGISLRVDYVVKFLWPPNEGGTQINPINHCNIESFSSVVERKI